MASINSFLPLSKPTIKDPNANLKPTSPLLKSFPPTSQIFLKPKHQKDSSLTVVRLVSKELDIIPVQSSDCTDHQDGGLVSGIEREIEAQEERVNQLVGGFGSNEAGRLSFEGAGSFSSASSSGGGDNENVDESKLIDRAINATIVLAAGTFAITKLLTIDHDYWHEFTSKHNVNSNLCIPTLEHGRKRLDSTISTILMIIQLTSPIPLAGCDSLFVSPAEAVLYSPDTKVPRTGELALRKAIPANTNMKTIQDSLEELSYYLRIPQRKPYGTMEGNVKKALKIAVDEKESILASLPADVREKGSVIYTSLIDGKGGMRNLLEYIKDKDPDKVSVALASSLDSVAQLELLQAPGLSFLLPAQYLKYPRFTGRGIVEFVIEKGDGSSFSPGAGGIPRKFATLQVVIDGYSAPLTTGNFAKLVADGAYNGMKLRSTDQAILSDSGLDNNSGYSVPLELMPSGQFEPLYKTTLSVQDGELPVLPLSVYGAVAMSHSDVSEEYSSPNQFFIYLYDKSYSGLGGLSFDEGQFSVFGYTTVGREFLPQIKSGDVVRSAKLVEGQDHLILPDEK